ncbi:hypothetical protein ACFVVX_30145 [Kitasatospora sp. NPDC058170]|uniref:hypothetical protein n=1 Tax=Kitasatospora sp. NPDC058170 TaxID=3346364 RepID=UPI0036DD9D5E
MRRAAVVYTEARIRLGRLVSRRRLPPRWVRSVLLVPAGALGWWLLVARGPLPDGAALGLLAAGGWGLGLIPVHADWRATGPRSRTGEGMVRVEAEPPIG